MSDNRQIKDGLGNLFTVRMRDLSAAHDGSVMRSMIFATPYPIDYDTGGIFQHTARAQGDIQANLAGAPIYAFRFASGSLMALVTKVRVNAWTTLNGFAVGTARFSMYVARGFTTQDGGGSVASFAGNAAKLATSMGSSQAGVVYSNGPPLTTTTDGRLLDPAPIGSLAVAAPTQASTPMTPIPIELLNKQPGEHPLLLGNLEGFVIQATVPSGGSWQFNITTEWAEVPRF